MNSDFEPPPKGLSLLAIVGGLMTGLVAIAGIEFGAKNLSRSRLLAKLTSTSVKTPITPLISPAAVIDLAKLDAASMALPQPSINPALPVARGIPYVGPRTGQLSSAEMSMARQAWVYFQRNWNAETGLINSVDGFASVTMWDQAAAIAAIVSAKEMGIIPEAELEAKLGQMLKTLATLPLYHNELPNKVYNAKTLMPVDYGQLEQRQEIGWSALDLGRLALWLKIVATKYPILKPQAEAVWHHWRVTRLVKQGQLYGTSIVKGREQYHQEGRYGYENYAAYGLKLWGLEVQQALGNQAQVKFINLYGQSVPYDQRDYQTSGANNYVLSEPYILDGIETGFQALPQAHAQQILAAQAARYQATQQLTALTEDNLDRSPYFVYNTLFVNGSPWSTVTDTQKKHNNLRFLSVKAAVGWHVLYGTAYTQKLFDFVQAHLKSDKGWYSGFYESLRQPNQVLTANNNGVILESLLYQQLWQPLTVWAGLKPLP